MAIIAAFKNGSNKTYTKSVHQFDKGQKLIVTGIELPENYEIHISNSKNSGIASSYVGHLDGTTIPDAYFVSGEYVYCWIYATKKEEYGGSPGYVIGRDGAIEQVGGDPIVIDEGTSVYEITIPVIKRPVQLPTFDMDKQGSGEESFDGYIVDENNALVPVKL